jgi:glucose dehydrogenase
MPTLYTVKEAPVEGDQPTQHYTTATMTDELRWGTLSAIDTHTGKIVWQKKTEKPLIGGVVATNGGLVFVGEGSGRVDAFDMKTGDLLWQFTTEAGVNAPPISYEVDGTQYVAIASGGTPMFGNKPGDELLVFALPK